MEHKRQSGIQVSNRVAFWIVLGCIVLVCYLFLLPFQMRRNEARQSAEKLKLILSTDKRFIGARVSVSTNHRVTLHGTVESVADLQDLQHRMEQEALVGKVLFDVKVNPTSKTQFTIPQ